MSDRPLLRPQEAGRLVLVLTDFLLVGAALWIGYQLRFELELGALERFGKAPAREYVNIAGVLGGVTLLLCHGWGLYRLHSLRSAIEETSIIAKAVSVATVSVLAASFFYREFTYSRLTFAYFWLVCIVLLAVAHALFRRWQVSRYRRGLDRRRVAIVGLPDAYIGQHLLHDPEFGFEVLGHIDSEERGGGEPAGRPANGNGGIGTLTRSAQARGTEVGRALPRLGSVHELASLLDSHPIEEIVVTDENLSHEALLATMDTCESRGVKVLKVLPVYDLLVEPEDFSYVHNVPLTRIDERRYHRLSRFTKRLFDIVVSVALLAGLSPVLLVIALGIRLGSKGPALFVQTRCGMGGTPFAMFKFRTMVDDAEGRLGEVVDLEKLDQPSFKVVDDPRITGFGRLLRRTSLDELPQLWNVLKGEMSLVGPRPEEIRVVDRYDVWQRRRLKVKPGITGLQQIEARGSLSSLDERVRLDVYYIRKQSLLLDLVILLRTFWAVLRGKGAT